MNDIQKKGDGCSHVWFLGGLSCCVNNVMPDLGVGTSLYTHVNIIYVGEMAYPKI